MKNSILKVTLSLAIFIFLATLSFSQGYKFTEIVRNETTPVKNQANSGTCWCYAFVSFLESELLRVGKGEHDLSEMFIVRGNYLNRIEDNYLRRGAGNLGEGSLAHMALKVTQEWGAIPQESYNGINYNSKVNNHRELNLYLKSVANASVSIKKRSPEYYKIIESILDSYLGEVPSSFFYRGEEYSPKSFLNSLELDLNSFVELTSFSHKPFYSQFPLEVPDNWDHAQFYNLPLDQFMEVIEHALSNGYTICWDGDVSERGFSHTNGVAVNPFIEEVESMVGADRERFEKLSIAERYAEVYKFERPFPEQKVDQELRQEGYNSFVTTDDHLMHMVGIAKDQNGTQYYITKNSWGKDRNPYGGYLYISDSYVRAKSISIMVNKASIPSHIRRDLGI
ncbi:MAG: C1 family peptidase [Bacteroidales bacterium]